MMDPEKTALVLIEYQNDFTSEGGTLHQAVKPVMDSTNMLANTVDTVAKARKLGATIVYAPITFTDDYHELSPNPYGILKGVVDSKSFRKGSWGAEMVDVLKPRPEDIVVEGKRGLCGFASTNLDFVLRSRGITNIALGGFLTNCCVESTMRTGYEKGYNVVTLHCDGEPGGAAAFGREELSDVLPPAHSHRIPQRALQRAGESRSLVDRRSGQDALPSSHAGNRRCLRDKRGLDRLSDARPSGVASIGTNYK
jgi:ureidoacrylate peracid hydrolase